MSYQEKNKIWLDIFKYIIVSEDLSYDLDEDKLIIKIYIWISFNIYIFILFKYN